MASDVERTASRSISSPETELLDPISFWGHAGPISYHPLMLINPPPALICITASVTLLSLKELTHLAPHCSVSGDRGTISDVSRCLLRVSVTFDAGPDASQPCFARQLD